MRKLLLSLAAFAVAGSLQAGVVTETITVSDFGVTGTTYVAATYTSDLTGVTYTAHMAGDHSSIQIRSNGGLSGVVISNNPNNYKVTQVELDFNSNTIDSRVINIYGKNDPYTKPENLSGSAASAGELMGSITKSSAKPLVIDPSMMYVGLKSKSGAAYLNSITFTYETPDGPSKEVAGLSFPEAEYSYTIGSGEVFTAPVLTKATNAPAVYSSSNTDVATVDATTGAVTIAGRGTTVILAECAENDEFLAGSASYTLTVTDPSIVVIYENTLLSEADDFTFEGNEKNIWKFNNYGLTGSGYINGAATSSSAMAYPPVLDLTEYEAPITITFEQAANNFKKDGALIPAEQLSTYCGVWAAGANSPWLSDELKMTLPETQSWTFVPTTINIDQYAGTKMKFAFWYQSSASVAGTWEIKNLKIEGRRKVVAKQEAELSFPEAEYTATLGEEFTAPELTKNTTAEAVYVSSNTDVATVDAATGVVTLVAAGTTVITAECAENDDFLAGTASYTLTVSEPAPSDGIFYNNDLTSDTSDFYFSDSPWVYAETGITADFTDATYPIYSWANSPAIDLTSATGTVKATFDMCFDKFTYNGNEVTGAKLKPYCGIYVALADDNNWYYNDPVNANYPETLGEDYVKTTLDLSAWAGEKIKIYYYLCTNKNTKGFWAIKNLKVGTEAAFAKQEAELSFPEAEYTATLGEEFTAPELTKNTTAEAVYVSSNTDVATVDAATGVVTLVAAGTTVITAECAENDDFLAGTASYTLTVSEPAASDDYIYNNDLTSVASNFTLGNGWEFAETGLTADFTENTKFLSSWSTSPIIDLTGISEGPITATFDMCFDNFTLKGSPVAVSNLKLYCTVYVSPANRDFWDYNPVAVTYPESLSRDYVTTTLDLSNYAGERIKFDFWRDANANLQGFWAIKNLKVTGKSELGTSVEGISTENEAAAYYDLQGRRVVNPEKGLYIRLQGGKATKVMF